MPEREIGNYQLYIPETPEPYVPPGFQETPGYREPSQSPIERIRTTYTLLDMYFKHGIQSEEAMREYLSHDTLEYLDAAKHGFYTRFDKTRPLQQYEYSVIERDNTLRHYDPDVEANEAFDSTVAIFSHMQKFSDGTVQNPSRKANLAAPATTLEYYDRLQELRREIQKVATGETPPNAHLQTSPALLRTVAFFATGSRLPLRVRPNKDDIAQMIEERQNKQEPERERINALTDGIDFSGLGE